jgi:predicted O-methyltransferase YrrM
MHSPFVFNFITNVLNGQQHKHCYQPIENRRAALLNNSNRIEVEDFGAGSGVIRSNKRRIDKIAASSLKPKKYAQLMHRMVSYYKPAKILELGTSFGITTSYLAKGSETAQVYTFEGSSAIAAIAHQTLDALSINNIILQQGNFDNTLSGFLTSNPVIDLAFLDGNHRKQPTLQYFEQLLGASNENTILIFDDIHFFLI